MAAIVPIPYRLDPHPHYWYPTFGITRSTYFQIFRVFQEFRFTRYIEHKEIFYVLCKANVHEILAYIEHIYLKIFRL